MIVWLSYALILAWLAILVGAVYWAAWFGRDLGRPLAPGPEPAAVVITAVKGASPTLPRFLAMLRQQAYGRYRVIAAVQGEDDPAFPLLRAAIAEPGAPLAVVVAGDAVRQGQKVQNLLRALEDVGPADEIVAFIDADTLPLPDWLARLARPLAEGNADAVTGYRWLLPTDGGLSSAAVAAANASVVTLPRLWHVLWGGTMAMRRETIERAGVRADLAGAIVDDVHLTRLCMRRGLRIARPRELLLASPVRHDWRSALAFGRRQYLFIRWYFPGLWAIAAGLLTVPLAGGVAALALAWRGDAVAIAALLLALGLGQVRASLRRRIVRGLWDGTALAPMMQSLWADRWLAPVWVGLHALCLWSSIGARHMWWAGIRYRFDGPNSVAVTERRAERADGTSR